MQYHPFLVFKISANIYILFDKVENPEFSKSLNTLMKGCIHSPQNFRGSRQDMQTPLNQLTF